MGITLTRLDDYQSWLLEAGGVRVLIDPWLDDEPITGAFDRRHATPYVPLGEVGTVDAVLLCTAVNDHLRPSTLRGLPAGTPMYVPRHAMRAAKRAVREVPLTGVVPDRPVRLGRLRVHAVPTGEPLSFLATAWLFEADETKVWFDPHLPSVGDAKRIGPVDALVASLERVRVGPMAVTAGARQVAKAAHAAQAPMVIATADDPARDMTPLQRRAYRVASGPTDLARHYRGRIVPVRQGEPIVIG